MQSVSDKYKADSIAGIRQLSWMAMMATDKRFQFGISTWVWDVSTWDGGDLWAADDNVLTEWNKYRYYDYSTRVVSLEWERMVSIPYSAGRAFGSFDLQNADGFFNYMPGAKAANFSEDFSLPLDPAIWFDWSGGTVQVSAGQLEISSAAGIRGIDTVYEYDLTGSYFSVELVDAGDQDSDMFTAYPVIIELDPTNALQLLVKGNLVIPATIVNGVFTGLTGAAYNPTDHRFFRIRESLGQIFYEVSPDAEDWTTLDSVATPFDVSAIELNIAVDSLGASSSAIFDNVNMTGSGVALEPQASPVAEYMVPGRPFRLLAGFSGEINQGIVGITTDAPEYDERERIVRFNGHDFFGRISDMTLSRSLTVEDMTTGEILTEILTMDVGLQEGQFVLDDSFNEIAFAFWPNGTKIGSIFEEVMEAEIGRLFMDENGIIRFYNRERLVGDPVITLDRTNIVELEQDRQTGIYNSIEVISNPSVVQDFQTVFDLILAEELGVGTTEFFFDTVVGEERVPVVEIQDITSYTANTQPDGSGSDITSQVSIQSAELLGDTVKVTIANTSGSVGYLTSLEITGRPAVRQPQIRSVAKSEESIEMFEERKLTIENDLIQTRIDADNLAALMLFYSRSYNNTLTVKVKSIPALQCGDGVQVDYGSIQDLFVTERIRFRLDKDGFNHYLDIRRSPLASLNFWEWDTSLWDGGDVWNF